MATVSTGTQTDTAEEGLGLRLSNSGPTSFPLVSTGNYGGRMKYAEPKDLPSYPSLGLKKSDAAASAAASLGWANTKSVSPWTPDKNASARKAASLANDSTMAASGQTGQNAPGSQVAAVLAAENAKRVLKRASMPASAWGNSAANQAFAAASTGGTHSPREPLPTLERQKSLRAAKGAMASSGRPRSTSSPLAYPDSANAASNALSAATIAHQPSVKHKMGETGASPITNMSRQMYTSNPPVKPEVDEKNREAVLHASALAMAKRMYTQQQTIIDSAKQAGNQDRESRPGSAGTDGLQQSMPFTNLQEAAYKLAQERLSRLHEEHQKNREFADYYGTSSASPSTPGRRLTKIGRLRRRASSEGDAASPQTRDDRNRSRQIRKQMSFFSTRLGEVDEVKRARDREALLAAAQRNVRARLEGMDEKICKEQGKIAPSKLNEWELKAHAAAQARSAARTGDRTDQIDLGAGVYMDREKVQEIAAKRVQPVLDEINEKAQTEHLRIAALKAEQEKKRLEAEGEKARNAEIKETTRQLKEEEKARNKQLKEEAKAREKEEKAAKAEEKRLAKEQHAIYEDHSNRHLEEKFTEETTSPHKSRLSRPFTPLIQTKGTTTSTNGPRSEISPLSPLTSPESANESAGARVKNWLRSRLHKPRAKSISVISKSGDGKTADKAAAAGAGGGFIGGHALTRFRHADGTGSMTSLSEGTHTASMREVALAGRPFSPTFYRAGGGDESGEPSSRRVGRVASNTTTTTDSVGGRGRSSSSVNSGGGGSSGSSTVEEQHGSSNREPRARTKNPPPAPLNLAGGMVPPRALVDPARVTPRSGGSPNRDSKFIEIIE